MMIPAQWCAMPVDELFRRLAGAHKLRQSLENITAFQPLRHQCREMTRFITAELIRRGEI